MENYFLSALKEQLFKLKIYLCFKADYILTIGWSYGFFLLWQVSWIPDLHLKKFMPLD